MNNLVTSLKARYTYAAILTKQIVKTDFKLRYQGSALGYLWSLLRPLAIFCILYIVFVRFLKVGKDVPHFSVYLLLGIVLWNFFIEITTGNVAAIVNKGDLIRKINFPKYVIVLAGAISASINLAINILVVALFMFIEKIDLSIAILGAPLLLLELLVFSIGIAFFLSATYVRFRDIGYIWEVVIQGAFYATPILYPLDLPVPLTAQKMLLLNPVAQIVQDARHLMITDQSRSFEAIWGNGRLRIIPVFMVVLTFILGVIYFRRSSKSFAESV